MQRIAILIFFLVLTASCEKEEIGINMLAGKWQWLRTDGGLGYHIHETPASTGKEIELELTSDQKYYEYTNGALTAQGTFRLKTETCIHDHTDKPVILFSSGKKMMIEHVDAETLYLDNNVYDGVGSQYERKTETAD